MQSSSELTSAYSPALLETLQTLIAPGQRARLSPFVESAQLLTLFGERPRLDKRIEDTRAILARHQADIEELAKCLVSFRSQNKAFEPAAYDERFLQVYLAYYMTTNVGKLQLILLDVLRRASLPTTLTVLDIGVGSGTTAVAILDLLVAWANVCDLYGAEFPVQSVQIVGVDANPGCLNMAQRCVNAYADMLAERHTLCPAGSSTFNLLEKVEAWARQSMWTVCDINTALPTVPKQPTLLTLSNVLNELANSGRNHLVELIRQLPDQSSVLVMEPGDQCSTQTLNRWRRSTLQAIGPEWTVLSPCGVWHGNRLPTQCDTCWSARRESLNEPLLYAEFRKSAEKFAPDKRGHDQFENDLLSWSYACLQRGAALHPGTVKAGPPNNEHTITTHYVGFFTKISQQQTPKPELLLAEEFRRSSNWMEYLRLCPAEPLANHATDQPSQLLLERKPGVLLPPLKHGDAITIHNVQPETLAKNGVLKLTPGKDTRVATLRERVTIAETFLREYTDRTSQAVDEIAYRLFGFQSMRLFQHRILEQALKGRSILGIAATGGGKSECFILPAMLLPGVTIVVSPLKSLMQDQYDQRICERYGLGNLSTCINGDVPFHERQVRLKHMELGHYKLVYFTPEQLERGYILDSLKRTNEAVGVRYIALDEAHCISQWGHDFRPSYLNLVRRLRSRGINPVRLALTATASPYVRRDLCEELDLNPAPLDQGGDVYVHSSNRPELNLIVRVARDTDQKADEILHELKELLKQNEHNSDPGAAIIFMPHTGVDPDTTTAYLPSQNALKSSMGRRSAGVTSFASYLERQLQRRVAIYHGKMDQDNEEAVAGQGAEHKPLGDLRGRRRRTEQTAFINGQREIMVATKGFGMGIDKPNIRLIIHRTPPANLEAYAQEAGRAGRDGELANVILLYSPDAPYDEDNWRLLKEEKSDFAIQQFFLSERYVRREDVIVMRAFLKTVQRRVGEYLYFTNDEAIVFFDQCMSQPRLAGQKVPYTWPQIPPKERWSRSPEHDAILEKGHRYEWKTKYIGRILSVLYKIRPSFGRQHRVAFLEQVKEAGARLKQYKLVNAKAILESNAYFGEIFRSKGVSEAELDALLNEGARTDLLAFARRLECSPSEAASLLWDINKFDQRNRWQSNLLCFSKIIAPKYGPAAGKDASHITWRQYAGALKYSLKSEAYERAKKNGRKQPNTDDWFYWDALPRSIGWEVLPGAAFEIDSEFDQYLKAFMDLHNQRQENDWSAYRRLLTDYVGVGEDGRLLPQTNRNCLRAVLLGYLETYEAVMGDNCHSCSRCVPDGQYETDIEKRKSVVVALSPAVIELLGELKRLVDQIPSQAKMDAFWQTVEAERKSGRAIVQYLEGWTGRMLIDMPGHQTALWVRILSMLRGLTPMRVGEFVDDARQLADRCPDDALEQIWDRLSGAHELMPDTAEIYEVQARVCHRLQRYADELAKWLKALELEQTTSALRYTAHAAIACLHSPGGPLPDAQKYAEHIRLAARLATDDSEAIALYRNLLPAWDLEDLQAEAAWLADNRPTTVITPRLLDHWLGEDAVPDRIHKVCQLISAVDYQHWPLPAATDLLQRIPLDTLAGQFGDLFVWWLDALAQSAETVTTEEFTRLTIAGVARHCRLPGSVVRRLGQALFEQLPAERATELGAALTGSAEARERAYNLLAHDYSPQSLEAIDRWLEWFGSNIVASDSDAGIRILARAAELSKSGAKHQAVEAQLRSLAEGLFHQPAAREQTHAAWLQLGKTQPKQLLWHLAACLQIDPPATGMAEACLDLLLKQPKPIVSDLARVLEASVKPTGSPRLDHLAQFIRLTQKLVDQADMRQLTVVWNEHLKAVVRVYKPSSSVDRADMAAAVLEHLRKITKPTWLTPVGLHAEALGYARRFKEAEAVGAHYPDLLVGSRREPLATFLKQLRGTERDAPQNCLDYAKIVAVLIRLRR